MAIQLTVEQERRIEAMVNAGAYPSTEEALDAAVAAVEDAQARFEGDNGELDALLAEGVNSGKPIEADERFWRQLTARTDQMVVEHGARKPR